MTVSNGQAVAVCIKNGGKYNDVPGVRLLKQKLNSPLLVNLLNSC